MTSPPIHDQRLANGLRLLVVPVPLAPGAAVSLWYDVGSRHESGDRTGLAHLFEHLMFQGSTQVAAGDHFALLQGVGGRLNATTSFDRTNYFETVPAHALDLALWLEADRMGGLLDALDERGLANQRDVVKNERRQRYDNQPYGTAWERLFAMVYPDGHPYHHMPIGSMEHLDATTLADCQEFFRAHYSPDNAVLTVAGEVDPDDVAARVERYFGAIPTFDGVRAPAPDGTIGPLRDEVVDELTTDVPAEAAYCLYRIPADGTAECDALDLAARVLAEGGSARLVDSLVRGQQLSTGLSMSVMRQVGGTAVLALVARARNGVPVEQLQAALDAELETFRSQGPTEAELVRAMAQAGRSQLDGLERVEDLADEVSRGATLFDDPARVFGELDRQRAVTVDAVRAASKAWLAPSNRARLTYRVAS